MTDDLFPYQRTGAAWLSQKRFALLADEMGLGKSAQAIVAADDVLAARVLVLCPASTRVQWIRQWRMWSARESFAPVTTGGALPSAYGLVCSYDLATRGEVCEALRARQWDLLILDEVHYLKSISAQRTQAILGKGGLIHHSLRTWALSGTPAPNHSGELYPLLKCFGAWNSSHASFVERFCQTRHTPFGEKITGSRNTPELRALMAPYILRRKVDDVMSELPAISFTNLAVEAGDVDEEKYFPDFAARQAFDELQSAVNNGRDAVAGCLSHADDTMAALRTFDSAEITTMRRYVGLQKVPAVADIVARELTANTYDKIVLFAYHQNVSDELEAKLKAFHPVKLTGRTPSKNRQGIIDKFVTNPKHRIFIGQIQAAGTGVDKLQTVCHHAILVEQSWVPGENWQAVMRLRRIGAIGKPVNIRIAGLADTVDEQIAQTLRRKTKDLTALFD